MNAQKIYNTRQAARELAGYYSAKGDARHAARCAKVAARLAYRLRRKEGPLARAWLYLQLVIARNFGC